MSFLTDPPTSNRLHNHHFSSQHPYINNKSNSLQSKSIQTPLQSLNVLLGKTAQKLSQNAANQSTLSQENSLKNIFSPGFYSHSIQQQQQQSFGASSSPSMQQQQLVQTQHQSQEQQQQYYQQQQQQVPRFRSFQTHNSINLCKKKLDIIDNSSNSFISNQDGREPKQQLNKSNNHIQNPNNISAVRFSACNNQPQTQQFIHELKGGRQQPQSSQLRRSVDTQLMSQQTSSQISQKTNDKIQQQQQQLPPQQLLEQKVEKKRYDLHLDEHLIGVAPTIKKPNTTMNITSTGSDMLFKSPQLSGYPNNMNVQRNKQFSQERKLESTGNNNNINQIKTSIVSLLNNHLESQNSTNTNANTKINNNHNKKLRQETTTDSYPSTQLNPSPRSMPRQADFPRYFCSDSSKKSPQLISPCNSKPSNSIFFPPQSKSSSLQSKHSSNINRIAFPITQNTPTTATASQQEKIVHTPQINCFMMKASDQSGKSQQLISCQVSSQQQQQQQQQQQSQLSQQKKLQNDQNNNQINRKKALPIFQADSEDRSPCFVSSQANLQTPSYVKFEQSSTTEEKEDKQQQKQQAHMGKLSEVDDKFVNPNTGQSPSALSSTAKFPLQQQQQQQQYQKHQVQPQQQSLIAEGLESTQQNDHHQTSRNQNFSANFSKCSYPTYTLQTFDQLESPQLSNQFCMPMMARNHENNSIQLTEMSVQAAPKNSEQRIPQQNNEVSSMQGFESHLVNTINQRNLTSKGYAKDHQVILPSPKSNGNQEFLQLSHPAGCDRIQQLMSQTPQQIKTTSKIHSLSQQQAPSVSYLTNQVVTQSCEITKESNCSKQVNNMQKDIISNIMHTGSTSATTGSQQDSQTASYEGDKIHTLGFTSPSIQAAPYSEDHLNNQSQQQQHQPQQYLPMAPPHNHNQHNHSQRLNQSSCCQFPLQSRQSHPETSTNTPGFPHNNSLSLCYSSTGSPSLQITNPPNSPIDITSSSEQPSIISKPIITALTPKANNLKPNHNRDLIIQIEPNNRRITAGIQKKEETSVNKKPSSQLNSHGINCIPSPKPNNIKINSDNTFGISNTQLKIPKNEHNDKQTLPKHPQNQFQTQQQQDPQKQQYQQIDNFEFLKLLGRGVFGRVYLVRDKLTRGVLALKVIEKQLIEQKRMLPQLNRELDIHRFIGTHPNILECLNSFQDQRCYYLLMEFVADGTVADLLHQSRRLSETQAATIVKHVLLALHHLHGKQVIHRDLKLENILLSNGVAKLCDFGCATYGEYNNECPQRRSFCGTIDYVSPEMISDQIYDKEIDVWAIGVIAFELASGYSPFTHSTEQLTYTAIKHGQFKCPSYFSSKLCDFLSKILVIDRKKRAKVEEMLNHPWILESSMDYLVS